MVRPSLAVRAEWSREIANLMGAKFYSIQGLVTLNLFQGPFLFNVPYPEARWMLKQVQHDVACGGVVRFA
jgi:hypothetical protein